MTSIGIIRNSRYQGTPDGTNSLKKPNPLRAKPTASTIEDGQQGQGRGDRQLGGRGGDTTSMPSMFMVMMKVNRVKTSGT